jgi:NAD(P)-dependent dehydrogenase (short-subunit alcohol dehydrogenase family)
MLGPPSVADTSPKDLIRCFEANSMAPFFALKYAPPAMGKTTPKGNYPNAAAKDQKYGSIIVVSSVASEYGGIYPWYIRFKNWLTRYIRLLGALFYDEFARCVGCS